jgi:hypothetical protein
MANIIDAAMQDPGFKKAVSSPFAAGRGTSGLFGPIRATQGAVTGAVYKALYPEAYQELTSSILGKNNNFLAKEMLGASISGNSQRMSELKGAFGAALRQGTRFGPSLATRLQGRTNWSAVKMGASAVGTGLRGANMASKMILGASLGQVGFATAAVAGIGYGITNALGISGSQLVETASAIHQGLKQASKPVYGYSELGQSTQGLVFGLNSRRTR